MVLKPPSGDGWKPVPAMGLVGPAEFESATSRLSAGCSNQTKLRARAAATERPILMAGGAKRRPPRHRMMEYSREPPAEAELLIIGGGVVGAATAFYAARAGLRPVVVEMRPAPCSLTTPASTGAFRLQFDNQQELELVRESV